MSHGIELKLLKKREGVPDDPAPSSRYVELFTIDEEKKENSFRELRKSMTGLPRCPRESMDPKSGLKSICPHTDGAHFSAYCHDDELDYAKNVAEQSKKSRHHWLFDRPCWHQKCGKKGLRNPASNKEEDGLTVSEKKASDSAKKISKMQLDFHKSEIKTKKMFGKDAVAYDTYVANMLVPLIQDFHSNMAKVTGSNLPPLDLIHGKLVAYLYIGDKLGIEKCIREDINWNWEFFIAGRTSPVTPLSLLCRPELSDALKDIRDSISIKEGEKIQLELIELAISKNKKIKPNSSIILFNKIAHAVPEDVNVSKETPESNSRIVKILCNPRDYRGRALSDVVYQGRVDILKLFFKYFPEIAYDMKELTEYGNSYLHMACYDSKAEMAAFLLDFVKIPVEVECIAVKGKNGKVTGGVMAGQTPLFWVFARGTINEDCARVLCVRGAAPLRIWHARNEDGEIIEGDQAAIMSPISLAVVTAPEWAKEVLEAQQKKTGNRGLKVIYKANFIGLLVSTRGKELQFAPQKKSIRHWDTFEWDSDRSTHKSLIEFILEYKRKDLIQEKILLDGLRVMWSEFAYRFYVTEFFFFLLYFASVFIASSVFNSGYSNFDWDVIVSTKESFYIGGTMFHQDDYLLWLLPCCVGTLICFRSLWREKNEMNREGFAEYFSFKNLENYADLTMIVIFLANFVIMVYIQFSTCTGRTIPDWTYINTTFCSMEDAKEASKLTVAWKLLNCIIQMSFCIKLLNFGSVPKVSGPFVAMIWRMFYDVFRFFLVFFVFFLAFLGALWPMSRDGLVYSSKDDGDNLYTSETEHFELFMRTMEVMFIWMLGDQDNSFMMSWREERGIAKVLFLLYAVVSAVLLLNMLIAMMGNTFNLIEEDKKGVWALSWAEKIFYIKRTQNEEVSLSAFLLLRDESRLPREVDLDENDEVENEKTWIDDVREGVEKILHDQGLMSKNVDADFKKIQERLESLERSKFELQRQSSVESNQGGKLNRQLSQAKDSLPVLKNFISKDVEDSLSIKLHVKARNPEKYPMREKVPDALVPWSVPFDSYNPPDHTESIVIKQDRNVTKNGWADPVQYYLEEEFKSRLTFHPPLKFDADGRPMNPMGRTGIKGRGLLGKWGPNQAADPILMRLNPSTKKPEVVLIVRQDTKEWAIPGGMVDDGDTVSKTLAKEFEEEAAKTDSKEDKDNLMSIFNDLQRQHLIYRGYVDDSRSTDNAWMETTAMVFLCSAKQAQLLRFETQKGETLKVAWVPFDDLKNLKLFASHAMFLQRALLSCEKYLQLASEDAIQLHVKARNPEKYPMREKVPDALVPWSVPFDSYNPPDHTESIVIKQDRNVTKNGWADPVQYYLEEEFKSRLTFHPPLKFDADGRPMNPMGRTGIKGRGLLGKWGPNQAADPILMRLNPSTKKPEVVLIVRQDTKEWAIPGGMVDDGDTVSKTLAKEFEEEAAKTDSKEDKDNLMSIFNDLQRQHLIYRGYVDDSRSTDNAWMETTAMVFLCSAKQAQLLRFETQKGETLKVAWVPFDDLKNLKLFASHAMFLQRALLSCEKYLQLASEDAIQLHVKARNPEKYPMREKVPDALVPWSVPFDSYNPPDHTESIVIKQDRNVTKNGWADPVQYYLEEEFKSRLTFHPPLKFDADGRPMNPMGRTGIKGRGLLGKWGPNQAADPILMRLNPSTKKPEVVLIVRQDTKEWAIPGGMVDDGDTVSKTLAKEFEEEAAKTDSKEDKDNLMSIFSDETRQLFVYRGYVDDSRNTDNAWMETTAMVFLCSAKQAQLLRFETQKGETLKVAWVPFDDLKNLKLFASHAMFLERARVIGTTQLLQSS